MQCLRSKLRQYVRQLQTINLSAIEVHPVLASSTVVSLKKHLPLLGIGAHQLWA